MMNPIWFLRMKRWVENPPSKERIRLVFGVIAICAVLYGFDLFFGWPEWLTPNKVGRGPTF